MNRDNLVSVCSLIDNPTDGLAHFLPDLAARLSSNYENYEIVLISNGLSPDIMTDVRNLVMQTPKTRLVQLANYYDENIVYSAALDTAIGDVVVLMDYRMDPTAIVPVLIEKILAGDEIVLANSNKPAHDPLWYKIMSNGYYRLVELLVSSSMEFDRTHFSAYSRRAVNLMTRHKSKIRNLRLLRNTLGLNAATIEYRPLPSRRRLDMVGRIFARAEEALSFSVRPLRIVTLLCSLGAVTNLAYAIYVIIAKLFTVTVPGWASAELAQSSMLCVLFFALGIIAMHLNIVLQEVQRRPSYTILNEISSSSSQTLRKNVVE